MKVEEHVIKTYITDDGQEFDNEEYAMEHERHLDTVANADKYLILITHDHLPNDNNITLLSPTYKWYKVPNKEVLDMVFDANHCNTRANYYSYTTYKMAHKNDDNSDDSIFPLIVGISDRFSVVFYDKLKKDYDRVIRQYTKFFDLFKSLED